MVLSLPSSTRAQSGQARNRSVPEPHRCRHSADDLLFGGVAQHAVAGEATREGCEPVAEIEATQHLDELGLRFVSRARGSRA